MSTNQIILAAVSTALLSAGLYGWVLCKAAKRGDERPEVEPPTPDTEHWDNYTTYRTNITHEQAN